MKAIRLSAAPVLILIATAFRLSAQAGEADRKFEDTKAKAEKGDAIAQWSLGTAYHKGDGVAKDDVAAAKWYRKAAEQNYAQAQRNLGSCYVYGLGVVKDEAEAVKWYRKAAEQNDPDAQFNLSACYFNGTGVAKNYIEAHKWLYLAAAQGSDDAKQKLPLLDQEMTPEQIDKGQQLAREFKPRKE